MYCKKCGKKLEDNERFCKRCGASVNGESAQKAKKREIEELSKNRIRRKTQRNAQSQDNSKQLFNVHINEKVLVLIIVLAALAIMIVPAVISYNAFTKNSENAVWRTQDGSVKINEEETVTPLPKKTKDTSTPYTITENTNEDGYKEFAFDGKIFLYPSTFSKSNTGGESRLKLVDASGDGTIELKVESDFDLKPQQLMLEFAQNNEVKSSRAGDNWYNIDLLTDVSYIHRKCVVTNGAAISYTFTYSQNSKYESLYQQYIEYMDEKFTY